MKLFRILGVVSIVALGSMGATANSAPKPQDKVPTISAKPKITKVRLTYIQCRAEGLAICRAQNPGSNAAALQCLSLYVDTYCSGLPGAP